MKARQAKFQFNDSFMAFLLLLLLLLKNRPCLYYHIKERKNCNFVKVPHAFSQDLVSSYQVPRQLHLLLEFAPLLTSAHHNFTPYISV